MQYETVAKSMPLWHRGDATCVWQLNPAEVVEDEPVSMARSGREEPEVPSMEPREH